MIISACSWAPERMLVPSLGLFVRRLGRKADLSVKATREGGILEEEPNARYEYSAKM